MGRSVFIFLLLSTQIVQVDSFLGFLTAPFTAIGKAIGLVGDSPSPTPTPSPSNSTGDGGSGGPSNNNTQIHETKQDTSVQSSNENNAKSEN